MVSKKEWKGVNKKKMIKGSHNTMSYLKPKCWFLRPFAIFAKCQDKNIYEQIQSNVRYFDFRLKLNKHNEFVFQHGLIEYKSPYTIYEILLMLNELGKTIYVRIWYENITNMSIEEKWKWETFKSNLMLFNFENLIIIFGEKGAKNEDNTSQYKIFGKELYEVCKIFNHWWEILLTPKYYAKTEQQNKIKEFENKDVIISQDFV